MKVYFIGPEPETEDEDAKEFSIDVKFNGVDVQPIFEVWREELRDGFAAIGALILDSDCEARFEDER